MQPKDTLIPCAIVACCISGALAFINNNNVSAEMQRQSTIEAKSATNQEIYNKNLDTIAREAIANKLTLVTFDDQGNVYRIAKPYPPRSQSLNEFKVGQKIDNDFIGNPSTGLFDPYLNKYVAIGELKGQMTIINVFSAVEVRNKISSLQESK